MDSVILRAINADGENVSITLNPENPSEFQSGIERYAELNAARQKAPLTAANDELKAELKAAKGILAGEIVRVKKLHPDFEDLDAEKEMAYLTGLSVERLQMEYDRIPKAEAIKADPVSKTGEPADQKASKVTVSYN